MEHKSLRNLSVKSTDAGTATAIFSRFGVVDSDGDVTLKTAFDDGVSVPISAYGHQSWQGALPVGRARLRVSGDTCVADCEFFMKTTAGRETFEVVKGLGDLGRWSYGYDVVKSRPGKSGGRSVRILEKLRVHEVSPVLVAAGVGTGTLVGSVKSGAIVTRADLTAIRDRWCPTDAQLRAEVRSIKERLELCAIKEAIDAHTRRHWSECEPPSPATVHTAWQVLKLTCAELNIDLPVMRWFSAETEAEADYAKRHGGRDWPSFETDVRVRGAWQGWSRTVWVAADLPTATTIATVAHEAAHAAGADEAGAQAYEARWVATIPSRN